MHKYDSHLEQSRSYAIRSNLIYGLELCALARAENRMGSVVRADLLLVKAKRVVENTSRELEREARVSITERHHLSRLADHLQASIGGLDPLWTPRAGVVPAKTGSDVVA